MNCVCFTEVCHRHPRMRRGTLAFRFTLDSAESNLDFNTGARGGSQRRRRASLSPTSGRSTQFSAANMSLSGSLVCYLIRPYYQQ